MAGAFFVARNLARQAQMPEPQSSTAVQTPPGGSAAAPPPTDWDRSLSQLEDVMREAETAANAQRDQAANGNATDGPADTEPTSSIPDDEAELADDEAQAPAPKPRSDERPEEPGDRRAPATETKRYSRKDAARLDSELQDTTRRLNEHASKVAHFEQTDRAIISRLVELTGSDGSYEQLSTKVLDGTATRDEHQKVQQMTEWRKVAGPVYRVAQQEVWNAFSKDFSELKKLEGVTEPVYQELLKTPNPAQMLRRVYDLGLAAGEQRKANETTRLSAAVTDLRTKRAADKPQPVPATTGAPTHNGRLIDRMFRPDGTLDPEYERRAERGEFLGADLTR